MKFTVYAYGICYASVCTDLPVEEATKVLNIDYPAGGKLKWAPSRDETFSGGEPNPCQCEHDPSCKHWLFEC